MKRINPALEVAVLAAYAQNQSGPQIARALPVSVGSVFNILRRHGVSPRPKVMQPKHKMHEDYFESIDTEAKAYWLGFIAADGCVSQGVGYLSPSKFVMTLAEVDTAHLESFRQAIGFAGPLARLLPKGRTSGFASLSFGRKRFVSHLVKQGIAPRKTWALSPPTGNVPEDLLRHYWRGFFDGDGSISSGYGGRSRRKRWEVGVVGTKEMTDGFAAFIRSRLSISLKPAKARNIWAVGTAGVEFPQHIAKLLYDGATVFLERKKIRVDELLAATPARTRLYNVDGVLMPAASAAAKVGIGRAAIRARISQGMTPKDATTTPHRKPPRPITYRGETHSINEWSRRTGIKRTTIAARLDRGESLDIVFRPVGT